MPTFIPVRISLSRTMTPKIDTCRFRPYLVSHRATIDVTHVTVHVWMVAVYFLELYGGLYVTLDPSSRAKFKSSLTS